MAQRKPGEHHIDEEPRLEMDEEALERIRNDPRVIVHYQKTTEPYVSRLRVTPGLDVLELLGRRGDDDDDEE
ncbi:MAG: hypothetical protein ACRDJW_17815 [Thermomicrobiales bacterium]